MEILHDSSHARESIFKHRVKDESIGLIPTMGALHEGHYSLIRESIRNNDVTVATIFVNPIQFNNPEDLKKYPVTLEQDLTELKGLGVDYVFIPSGEEMYPKSPVLELSFGHLGEVMEAKYRPGHFNGVAIVVAKLFNILTPTRAYFGQKDLQQFKIIEQMVKDLSFDIELVMMPIVREESGLAMSSRNRRLTHEGLSSASEIFRILSDSARALQNGTDRIVVIEEALNNFKQIPAITTEYLELANFEDLGSSWTDTESNRLVLCFAGYVEGVRLIDNVIVGEKL